MTAENRTSRCRAYNLTLADPSAREAQAYRIIVTHHHGPVSGTCGESVLDATIFARVDDSPSEVYGWSQNFSFSTEPRVDRLAPEFEAVEGFAKFVARGEHAAGNLEPGQCAEGTFTIEYAGERSDTVLKGIRRELGEWARGYTNDRLAEATHDVVTALRLSGEQRCVRCGAPHDAALRDQAPGQSAEGVCVSEPGDLRWVLVAVVTNLAWLAALVGGVL